MNPVHVMLGLLASLVVLKPKQRPSPVLTSTAPPATPQPQAPPKKAAPKASPPPPLPPPDPIEVRPSAQPTLPKKAPPAAKKPTAKDPFAGMTPEQIAVEKAAAAAGLAEWDARLAEGAPKGVAAAYFLRAYLAAGGSLKPTIQRQQSHMRLKADGIAGPKTKEKMANLIAGYEVMRNSEPSDEEEEGEIIDASKPPPGAAPAEDGSPAAAEDPTEEEELGPSVSVSETRFGREYADLSAQEKKVHTRARNLAVEAQKIAAGMGKSAAERAACYLQTYLRHGGMLARNIAIAQENMGITPPSGEVDDATLYVASELGYPIT